MANARLLFQPHGPESKSNLLPAADTKVYVRRKDLLELFVHARHAESHKRLRQKGQLHKSFGLALDERNQVRG